MNIRLREDRDLRRCLLGNQIDLHKCLLGNCRGNQKLSQVRQPELEVLLTKRQLKHRQNKVSNLSKKFKNLEKENDNLKSQMEALEDKIKKHPKYQC